MIPAPPSTPIRLHPLTRWRSRAQIVLWALAMLLILKVPMFGQAKPPELLPPPQTSARIQTTLATLADFQAFAEAQSPNLQRAAAEVQVQRGRAWQARAYPNPELQGGSPQWGGSDSQYYAMLSQEIVTARKLQLDRAAVSREVQIAEFNFVKARFELLTKVRQAFYGALTAQQRLQAYSHLLEIVRRTAKASFRLEQSGDVARGDNLIVELELEKVEFGRENAAAAYVAASRQLATVIGVPDMPIERLQGDLSAPLPDYPFQLTQAGVLTRNSLVHAADAEIQRNQYLLQRAHVQPIPNITVGAGYMYQVPEPHNMAMLQVTVPIPVWNRNQGNIRAAQAGVTRASFAAEQTRLDVTQLLAAATGRFEIATQQTQRYEKAILPKAQESVRLTQRGFDEGQFDFLRVLQAQRTLIESELNYLAAQEARWNSAAEIAGLLQEEAFPPAGK